jgi:hypothetical protein
MAVSGFRYSPNRSHVTIANGIITCIECKSTEVLVREWVSGSGRTVAHPGKEAILGTSPGTQDR